MRKYKSKFVQGVVMAVLIVLCLAVVPQVIHAEETDGAVEKSTAESNLLENSSTLPSSSGEILPSSGAMLRGGPMLRALPGTVTVGMFKYKNYTATGEINVVELVGPSDSGWVKGAIDSAYPYEGTTIPKIPATITYGGVIYTVKSIGAGAFTTGFYGGTPNIPDTIVNIGDNAFAQNFFTGDIVIPSSVKNIGSNAFYDNSLNDVVFSDGFNGNIAGQAFANNELRRIKLPSTFTTGTVGDYAFSENGISLNEDLGGWNPTGPEYSVAFGQQYPYYNGGSVVRNYVPKESGNWNGYYNSGFFTYEEIFGKDAPSGLENSDYIKTIFGEKKDDSFVPTNTTKNGYKYHADSKMFEVYYYVQIYGLQHNNLSFEKYYVKTNPNGYTRDITTGLGSYIMLSNPREKIKEIFKTYTAIDTMNQKLYEKVRVDNSSAFTFRVRIKWGSYSPITSGNMSYQLSDKILGDGIDNTQAQQIFPTPAIPGTKPDTYGSVPIEKIVGLTVNTISESPSNLRTQFLERRLTAHKDSMDAALFAYKPQAQLCVELEGGAIELVKRPEIFDFGNNNVPQNGATYSLDNSAYTSDEISNGFNVEVADGRGGGGWDLEASMSYLTDTSNTVLSSGAGNETKLSFKSYMVKDGATLSPATMSPLDSISSPTSFTLTSYTNYGSETNTSGRTTLYTATSAGNGTFKMKIPYNSVKLNVPVAGDANAGRTYKGEIIWWLSKTP